MDTNRKYEVYNEICSLKDQVSGEKGLYSQLDGEIGELSRDKEELWKYHARIVQIVGEWHEKAAKYNNHHLEIKVPLKSEGNYVEQIAKKYNPISANLTGGEAKKMVSLRDECEHTIRKIEEKIQEKASQFNAAASRIHSLQEDITRNEKLYDELVEEEERESEDEW